ncbi:HlyD family secretion protein [Humitalea rosea]|uniref:HlyD family secretion protein n=1 Tax=Humitalea rosea TaxID=990373 RepID=A0A2W7IJF7_9PROT|nr:HlyD family efflux transporter periplasmic adaptor subunit [Humitalea rosea]PZW46833.1 HlyD family secretion protein [Humitalea rosea]
MKRVARVGVVLLVLAAAGGGYLLWRSYQPEGLPAGFASGNGRIEAVEIDIAAKSAGRIREILANEGEFVTAGQVLARMDTAISEAQLREAEAGLQQAIIGIDVARSQVRQREADRAAALAVVDQREAELDAAQRRVARSEELAPRGTVPAQRLDDDRASFQGARAAVSIAQAQVAAADAALGTARSQVIAAQSAVEATRATIQRIQTDIDDGTLRSPRDGRVQYRVAQPGEVVSAGGRVLNLVDLVDVYMTFFLPTEAAGRVAIGTEVRLVLDAVPTLVIPAQASFVAAVAQFTPRTVETAEERLKLMFRIKARIDPGLLRQHIEQVKTGVPGIAYIRLDPAIEWPARLQVRLPQ